MSPAYLKLTQAELKNRIKRAIELLESCTICPRNCKVNRLNDERGFCGVGRYAIIASYGPHLGEEAPLVGSHGSGTIFIAGCNLKCVFCQNFEISHLMEGYEVTPEQLAKIMIYLKNIGCHNINIVTPTHVVPQILEALPYAIELGLDLPIVYNTGGYDKEEVLKLLDNIVDIYMPDIKFVDKKLTQKFMHAPDYFEVCKSAVKEMHRQVGDLILENGIATKGLLVRHLVMPNELAGTEEVVRFLSQEISKDTYINIMAQYRPCGYAHKYPEIARRITYDEYKKAILIAQKYGLHRFDKRI